MKELVEYIIEKQGFLVKKNTVAGATTMEKKGEVDDIDKLDVGDILVSAYSYNSRNVHFYKVIGTKGKSTVYMHELGGKMIKGAYNSPMGGEVEPNEEKENKEQIEGRIGKNGLRIKDLGKYYSVLYFYRGPEHVYPD